MWERKREKIIMFCFVRSKKKVGNNAKENVKNKQVIFKQENFRLKKKPKAIVYQFIDIQAYLLMNYL